MKNRKNGFIIFDFMYNRLGLSGAELLVFALVYSYCRTGGGRFFGTRGHIAERTGLSLSSVSRVLGELCRRGILIKEGEEGIRGVPSYRLGEPVLSEAMSVTEEAGE
nr:helix-turn-helix domain-containing protein [Clostridia bacterium]